MTTSPTTSTEPRFRGTDEGSRVPPASALAPADGTVQPSFAARLRRAVLAPIRTAGIPENRTRLELLAVLSLAMLATLVAVWIQVALAEPEIAHAVWPLMLAVCLLCAAAYVAARLGAVRAAGWTIVAVQSAGPLSAAGIMRIDDLIRQQVGGWVVLGILTANATLGSRAVLGTGVSAALALLVVWLAAGSGIGAATNAAVFPVAFTVAVYVYARHRDAREADRQRQLQRRNDELEDLRASLESRVGERTAELVTAHAAIVGGEQVLRQSEKMAAVGRLTAGFAHELATPLSSMASSLDIIETLRCEYTDSIGDASVTSGDHQTFSA
jgi:signal transduction histidine kinase